ncbi:thiolase C-terminal domain-containing protein [Rhodococcus opacus]|uniref:Lipid-transfer protein n=1 Tax=Rhodococcus opacus TaxID=37919 RepID=A0A076F5E3_RHOOP|nr:lipid-transfer protein [Rhodococcus opacus]AII10889.1 lipid-transfer protein [Rhodococcus opacus]
MTDFADVSRDQCAIAGVGSTDFSSRSGRSVLTLATQACLAALSDAGLDPADVDGIVRCDIDQVLHNDLASSLGTTNLRYWSTVGTGGGAPCGMVAQAVAAIQSGQAKTVVVFRALNGRSGIRFGQPMSADDRVGGRGSYDEFFVPYGVQVPGHMFSMMAQRHMAEYGTTQEQLGQIAVTCRQRANDNPNAQMSARTMTMDDYLSSRLVSSPLRLFDYCLETDGACAVVVTSTERARDLPNPPALIRAVAQGTVADEQPGYFLSSLLRESLTTWPSAPTAKTLYERAGCGPQDIDVAQIYDCFTITTLIQLEDYGFCATGEGGPFAASGALDLTGSLPINTAGGHLSEGYIHGLTHIVEGVRQIRGTAVSQVERAETCLVTSGVPNATSAMILRKDT